MAQVGRSSWQWAELVTTVGVLVSLVFVGLEIRQNTSVARSQARTDLATLNQDWLMGMAGDPALLRSFDAHWLDEPDTTLTPLEQQQAFLAMVAVVRRLENAYLFYEEDLIPEEALGSYGMRGPWFELPAFRDEFWPGIRDTFDPSFVAFANRAWGL